MGKSHTYTAKVKRTFIDQSGMCFVELESDSTTGLIPVSANMLKYLSKDDTITITIKKP